MNCLRSMNCLCLTLIAIGLFQLLAGSFLLLMPAQVASFLGLEPAVPVWAYWLFAMMGARFLGFACGMFFAACQPYEHRHWIAVMVGIQVIDLSATIFYVIRSDVTLETSRLIWVVLWPIIFIIVLVTQFPRDSTQHQSG